MTSSTEEANSGADMHEVLFTRGDVAKAPRETQLRIHSIYNCLYVAHEAHPEANTAENRQKCIGFLIKIHGRIKLMEWVHSVGGDLRNAALVDRIINEIAECPEWYSVEYR